MDDAFWRLPDGRLFPHARRFPQGRDEAAAAGDGSRQGALRFDVDELDAFDHHLREPWAPPGNPRPDIAGP